MVRALHGPLRASLEFAHYRYGDRLRSETFAHRPKSEPEFARHRYGDGLRSGWRSVMDMVVRLHKLGLLPASVAALEGEDAESAAGRLPRAAAPRNSAAPSLLSRAFSRHVLYHNLAQLHRSLWCPTLKRAPIA